MDLDIDIGEMYKDILLSNLKESQRKLKEYFDIDNWSEPEFSDKEEEVDNSHYTFLNCSSKATFAGETIELNTTIIGDTSNSCDTVLITNKGERIYIDNGINGPVEEFNSFGDRVIYDDSDHKKWIKFMTDSLPKLTSGSDQETKVLRYILEKT